MARLDAAVAKADAEPPCSDRLDLDLRRASASFDLDEEAGGEGLDVAAPAFRRSHDSLLYAKGAAASRAGSLGAMPADPERPSGPSWARTTRWPRATSRSMRSDSMRRSPSVMTTGM
jgi:hypothetical protein